MKPADSGAGRCRRCGGSGDIPIIAPDCFVHPDARPLLQCCPDCNGTGFERDEALALEEVQEDTERRRARR